MYFRKRRSLLRGDVPQEVDRELMLVLRHVSCFMVSLKYADALKGDVLVMDGAEIQKCYEVCDLLLQTYQGV